MTDCCKMNDHGDHHDHHEHDHHPLSHNDGGGNQAGRTLLAGLLGGIASAAGYVVYTRLPDEQKERLHHQVRELIESRLSELRSSFKI